MKVLRVWFLLFGLLLLYAGSISAQDLSILGTISTEKEIDSLALSPNTGIAYGISSEEKTLYIFDLKSYSIKKTIKLDNKPRAIAVNTSDNTAYITSSGDNSSLSSPASYSSCKSSKDNKDDNNKGGNDDKDDKDTNGNKDGGDNKDDGDNKNGDSEDNKDDDGDKGEGDDNGDNEDSKDDDGDKGGNDDTEDDDNKDSDNETKGILYKVDSDGNISSSEIDKDPQGIAVNSGTNEVVIAIEKDKQLLVLSTDTDTVTDTISLTHRPKLIALDTDTDRAVVVAGKAEGEGKQNQILILEMNTGTISYTIELKNEITGIAVDTEKDLAVAVSKDEINVIDINTGSNVFTSGLSDFHAESVDVNQSTHIAVITGDGGVLLLDLSSLSDSPISLFTDSPLSSVAVDKYKNTALLSSEGNSGSEGDSERGTESHFRVIEIQLSNPVPSITNLIPKSARAGESGFSLKVEGDKFITTSSVQFNESSVSTTFKDNKELEASISSGLIESPGSVPVTVTNPSSASGGGDGGTSEPYSFTIKYPSPILSSLSPDTVTAKSSGFTFKAYGSNFMDGYVINFNGENLSTAYISGTELNATVTSSLIQTQGTYSVTVSTPDGQNSNYLNFTVTDPYPSITSFTPKEGQVGTVVTITGNNFSPEVAGGDTNTPTKVFFPPYQGGTEGGVQAIIQNLSQTEIKTSVPSGATTGPIKVETSKGSATSTENFTVLSKYDFSLNISPESVSIPYNGKASTVVTVQSTGLESFSGLVKLSVSVNSVSDSVTTNFNPEHISVNKSSILTINSSALSSASTLTISGTATIEGTDITRTASLTIEPIAEGTTTITGQVVASKDAKPIKGVTLTIGDKTEVTDDAGYFHFIDPPTGEQILMINGESANTDLITYPSSVPMPVTITAGIDNKLPYFIYLHEVNTKHFTPITSTSTDIIVTDPEIPDFEMKIPAGVEIIGWDGVANEKVSVKMVSRDRLPIPPPPDDLLVQTVFMFYFGKPGGGTPTQPIPVKLPNTLGSEPGTKFDMYYYDEEPNPNADSHQWKKFGTGTVSDDGRQVASDEGYGIPKFCCGAVFLVIKEITTYVPNPNPDCGSCCHGGNPIDLTTGVDLIEATDVVLNGRMPIELKRTYRTMDYNRGPFGIGTSHNYDAMLTLSSTKQRMAYILPDGGKYYFYIQDDGSFKNTDSEKMYGATAYLSSDNSRSLKFKDGTTHRFNTSGRLTELEDRNGNKITISRQSGGQITSIKEPAGREITFSNDSSGRITSITAPLKIISYTYNTNDYLETVTDPNGGVTRYTYDTENRIQKVTDARGTIVVQNEYDSYDRVTKQTLGDGGEYNFKYFSSSTPVRVEQPIYPKPYWRCQLEFVREGESPTTGGQCGVVYVNVPSSKNVSEDSTATYSINQTIMINPNGSSTTYRFDGQGYILSITDGLGGEISHERDTSTKQLLSVTDQLGRKTSYTYDSNGNVATITDPSNNVTSYEYDLTFNKPTKITDAMGNVTTMEYDEKGNLIKAVSPQQSAISISYNSYGQPTSITDALNNTTTFEYDQYGNLTKTTDPLGNSAKMEYDYVSRLIAYTDPKDNVTQYAYDNLNRIIEVMDDLDGKTRFTYDANGNLLTVTDAKNQMMTYTYNNRNKVASMTDQLGNVETYEYDLNDNLSSITDRKGQKTEYTYDYLDRVTKASYSDGNSTEYFYDAVSRLTTVTDTDTGMIEYSYSNSGCSAGCSGGFVDKVIKETTSLGTINYTYDAIGRRTSMTVAGQPTVSYTYDSNSRLTDINTTINNVAAGFSLRYDSLGRRTSLSLPNGVTTSYTYDNASHLLALKHLNSLNIELEVLNYLYDANGNRTSMDRQNVSVKLPNPVSNTSYNDANQLLTFNDKSITYDNNGNMETITNSCGTTTYTWDAHNRLVGINGFTLTSTSTCESITASFKYDALGRRIEKSVTDTVNGTRTTNYLYDGLDIIQEIENGTVTVNYIRTLNIDEPLARISNEGTIRYYQADALGSVIALTDENGNIKTQYSYDPFGNTTITGESSDNPFQYTGKPNDGTGLFFYNARYYSPELQRFISEDPLLRPINLNCVGSTKSKNSLVWVIPFLIKDPQKLHAYNYVNNNVTNRIDPLGLIDSGCASNAFDKFKSCLAISSAAISLGMDWAFAACFFTGPAIGECMVTVLGIAGHAELIALAACGYRAVEVYNDCAKDKKDNECISGGGPFGGGGGGSGGPLGGGGG